MEYIESEKNLKFKYWNSLLNTKVLKTSDHFIMGGKQWVLESIKQRPEQIDCVLFPMKNPQDIDESIFENLKIFHLKQELFEKMDTFGSHFPLLILRKPQVLDWSPESKPVGISLLCPMGEPSNLGALLRNASAFGVKDFVLLKESCNPFHPKSVRAAAGNLWGCTLFNGPSIHDLDFNNPSIFALDMEGADLSKTNWPDNLYLLIGEEGPGIPRSFPLERKLSIPIEGKTESLNAYFAASIALYDFYSKKRI